MLLARIGFSAATIVVAVSAIRGAPKEKEHLYRPDPHGNWRCLSRPDIVLSFDQVNDDYCDCPDGSDEPGTSGCQNTYFFCENAGHIPHWLPSSRVDDGVCDYDVCCDGSDEPEGLCPDRCAEIHQQYEERKRVEAENVQRGLAGREKLVKEAFRIKEAIKKDIHDLTVELEQTEQRLLLEQQELDESMIAAQQVGQSPQALRAKELVEKLDNERNIAKSAVTALIDRLTTVENMLNSFKEKYDPVQEDPVITDLITTWELLSSQWSAVEESSDHTSYQEIADAIDNIQLPVPINMSLKQRFPFLTRARLWLAEQGLAAYPSESTNFAESPFTRKLKQTVEATERSISDLKRNCENKKQELDKDYGPDDVLLGLRDDCAKGHFGDYDYEVCFLKSVTQDGNGHRSNLGNYASYSQDPVSGTLMFSFENGAKCWSGQIRQSRVQVTCGEENKILSVTEPEKCEYHMKLISPAACIPPSNSGNKNEAGKDSSSPVEHPDL